MALELKYEIEHSNDPKVILIKDTTGVYSVNNTTGWGAPNVNRNDFALVLYAKYNPYNLPFENVSTSISALTVIDFDVTYDNDHQTIFELEYTKDGWYTISVVAVPIVNGAPVENDIIFDTDASELVIYKTNAFVTLTSPDWEYLLDPEKYTLVSKNELFLLTLICKRNDLLEELIKCYECTSCKCQDKENELTRLNIFIQGTDYRFHSEKEYEAQRMVEILTKQFKC